MEASSTSYVFALGFLLNSEDLLDLKMILITAENMTLPAKCVAKHLDQAGRFGDIPVGLGSILPLYYEEATSECLWHSWSCWLCLGEWMHWILTCHWWKTVSLLSMIWFLHLIATTGGTLPSEAKRHCVISFKQQYPKAAAKLDTLVVMGGNWCAGFNPYPGVTVPTGTLLWNKIPMLLLFYSLHMIYYSLTDEMNIGCDPMAANDVLESDTTPFTKI